MDFPLEEYRGRLERTQGQIAKAGLSGLILHGEENIAYLSGFQTPGIFAYHSLVVPARGEPVLVLRQLEEAAADETSWVTDRSAYIDAEDPAEALKRAVHAVELERERVGVEYHSWFLTLERYERMRSLLPGATFVREPKIVDHVRLIKSPREVAATREAARIVEAAMTAGIEAARKGVDERELAAAIHHALILGGSEPPLRQLMATGPRTRFLHPVWAARRLESGDLVYYELMARVKKYQAKLMRTGVIGEPTREQRRTAEILLRAQTEGIALMRPGTSASEVDAACREPVLKAGLRATYTNRVGYTIGILYSPAGGDFTREFVLGADWKLEAGMVFHMLVMAQGIGFSETVLVGTDGPELLTRFARELFVR